MRRRTFLAASAAALALPSVVRAQGKSVLKFIAQSDLAVLDPVWTTAYVTRNHGYMVFDTLYGQTGRTTASRPRRRWWRATRSRMTARPGSSTLRDGLMFHDGSKVLARDCVASIKRWGARDAFGQALMAAHRRALRAGRQDHRVPAEAALRAVARRAGPRRHQHVRDHARAAGRRPIRSSRSPSSSAAARSVSRRMSACRARCSSTSASTTTSRASGGEPELHRRPQDRAFRPGRMARASPIAATAAGGAASRRDGLVGKRRPPTCCRCCSENQRQDRISGSHRQPRRDAAQPSVSAVRQAGVPPRADGCDRPDGFMTAMMGEDTSLWQVPTRLLPAGSPMASEAGMPR